MGLDPAAHGPEIRARLGVVPQQDTLDTELSVRDNLVIYARYFGMSRAQARQKADGLLDFVQLLERAPDYSFKNQRVELLMLILIRMVTLIYSKSETGKMPHTEIMEMGLLKSVLNQWGSRVKVRKW